MVYDGTVLILDNFRAVLADYSVDVQDVVRSAILDGVDLSAYIKVCKDPYKLDQIRLSLKEELPEAGILFSALNGEQLYSVRKLRKKGYDVSALTRQLTGGKISGDYLDYVIAWEVDGVNYTGIKVSMIPKKMLEIFDKYLRQGRDMSPFNNGMVYSDEYIRCCMLLQVEDRDVSRFASKMWSEQALSSLCVCSKKLSKSAWSKLMSAIDVGTSCERIQLMSKVADSHLNIEALRGYDDESVEIIYNAYKDGLNYSKLMLESETAESRREMYNEMKMKRGKKLSGVVRRGT